MKSLKTSLFVGAAAVLLSGAFGFAVAGNPANHVLTVQLPGGSIEQIQYQGDAPPHIVVAPDGWPIVSPAWAAAFFGAYSPFAQMEQISAAMDRQMQAMLNNVDALAIPPGWVTEVRSGKLPAGSESYSFVSTSTGNGVCARSVEITATGGDQKPHVVSRTYGDCGSGHAGLRSGVPAEDSSSDMREIRYTPHVAPANAPYLREASATE